MVNLRLDLKHSWVVYQQKLSGSHNRILDFSFLGSNRKRSRNGSRICLRGCLKVRSAPFFEPDPSGGVLGPCLAGKRIKTDQNFNLDISFRLRPLVRNASGRLCGPGAGRFS